jgi:hypothetical protein
MAIVQRELQLPSTGYRRVEYRAGRRAGRIGPVFTLALGGLALWLAYSVLSVGMEWAQVKMDDIRYGYPRTYQTDGYIGYGEASGLPTHFVVINAHRQVLILIVPGTDPAHVRVIRGPYLFGPNQEFSPATVQLEDLSHDGYPDLVLHVAGQTVTYTNDPRKHTFVLSHTSLAGAQ